MKYSAIFIFLFTALTNCQSKVIIQTPDSRDTIPIPQTIVHDTIKVLDLEFAQHKIDSTNQFWHIQIDTMLFYANKAVEIKIRELQNEIKRLKENYGE